MLWFRPRWRCRQKPFISSHNQKEDNNESKNNKQQKCQKIKLLGTLTMKELRKHSTRLVGRSQASGRVEKTRGKVADCMGVVG